MCAIFGFAGQTRKGQWRQTHDLLTALFVASEVRGKDASGFAACLSPYANPSRIGALTSKSPDRAVDFVRTDNAWHTLRYHRSSAAVGHTRWATHGSPLVNANNHPHHANGMYLVHNGIITQHEDTAERLGIQLATECDSELLLGIVEISNHPVEGVSHCLKECAGSMAVAVLDPIREQIVLARNSGRPIHILRMKNDSRTFFASTEMILLSAFQHVLGRSALAMIDILIPLAAGIVHVLRGDGTIHTARQPEMRFDLADL